MAPDHPQPFDTPPTSPAVPSTQDPAQPIWTPADPSADPVQGNPSPGPRILVADLPSLNKVLVPLAIGAAVAVVLGVYGKTHDPTGVGVSVAGFSGPLEAKTWLATGAFLLALVQVGSALVMYGKIPSVPAPPWIGTLHRWSGRAAFLLTLPVAVHCLYAAAFQTYDLRVTIHSLMGCFFFGVFTAKMLILPRRGVPGWVLPLVGGLVFTALVVLWLTSSLWFFTTQGVRF